MDTQEILLAVTSLLPDWIRTMDSAWIYAALAFGVLAGICLAIYSRMAQIAEAMHQTDETIIHRFRYKTMLVPVVVETLRTHGAQNVALSELLALYERSVLTQIHDVAEIMDANVRMENEWKFVFALGMRLPDLEDSTSWTAARQSVMDSERELGKLADTHNAYARRYNRLKIWKNLTLVGLLIPRESAIEI